MKNRKCTIIIIIIVISLMFFGVLSLLNQSKKQIQKRKKEYSQKIQYTNSDAYKIIINTEKEAFKLFDKVYPQDYEFKFNQDGIFEISLKELKMKSKDKLSFLNTKQILCSEELSKIVLFKRKNDIIQKTNLVCTFKVKKVENIDVGNLN